MDKSIMAWVAAGEAPSASALQPRLQQLLMASPPLHVLK